MSSSIPRFKVALIGDGGVGKTTFIERYQTNIFNKSYRATMGVEVNPLPINTSTGQVMFNIWDTAGQERFSGLGVGYLLGANAVIIMVDLTNSLTYKSVSHWIALAKLHAPEAAIIIIGNKSDCNDQKITSEEITNLGLPSFIVSTKDNIKCSEPMLYLTRTLLKNDTLILKKKYVAKTNKMFPGFPAM